MNQRPLLAAVLFLVGCLPEEPLEPDPEPEPCPTWYSDLDRDGYGNHIANPVVDCTQPPNHVANNLDCNDGDSTIHPDAAEVCDPSDVDENCNGLADNEDPEYTGAELEFYPDNDGDGHGDGNAEPQTWCDPPEGWTEAPTDCDDADPQTYPGAASRDSGFDCMRDHDGDGWGDSNPPAGITPGRDCDDADILLNPDIPDDDLDGIDQNCDGLDGPTIADDFESGSVDATTWPSSSGAAVQSGVVANGSYALELSLTDSVESKAIDTSACASIFWSYEGSQAVANPPDSTDYLHLEYHDGSGWVQVDRWPGPNGAGTWTNRWGVLTEPGVLHGAFKVRLRAQTTMNDEWFYVDDFVAGCAADGDGDTYPDPIDCAPADPYHWSDCGSCTDADGDHYGSHCDYGDDCDDNDVTVNPLAADPYGDGVDADCSGYDGEGLYEDFEGAWLNSTWIPTPGVDDHIYDNNAYYVSGTGSLRVEADGIVTRQVYDLGACSSIIWEYEGKRGPSTPEAGDELFFEVNTASGWIVADMWDGGATDAAFVHRQGFVGAPDLDGTQLEIRFRGAGIVGDDWFIDDVRIHCAGDVDGDGTPDALDCSPNDPDHWADCGNCTDTDADGFGDGCDLGWDCDDGDATVNPLGADTSLDGVDQDCDFFDGAALVYDDFETPGPDPAVWATWGANVVTTGTYVGEGTTSLDIKYNTNSTIESHPIDTSACPAVAWSFLLMTGGAGVADAGDLLFLEYWDGASWILAEVWDGADEAPNAWSLRQGLIPDAAAASPGFKLRLRGNSTTTSDHWYVDALSVGCTEADDDGDGYPNAMDCDRTDALHWSDCGLCVDGDADGFGRSCDLGSDCDDADATIHPGAADATVDGVDQNCDLFDGDATLYDDIELGGPDPAVWSTWGANVWTTSVYTYEGSYALDIVDDIDATIESHPVDLSACPAVAWSLQLMTGGAGAADSGDTLTLEYWDGTTWRFAAQWDGKDETLNQWSLRNGIIPDPAALISDFKLRLVGGSSINTDHWYVDVVQAGCTGADNDGDGYPNGIDCNDNDVAHWSDCGLCVDLDGDGYGQACDLGMDCDDADVNINPDAPDLLTDGLDQNCDSIDGPTLVQDDFETGGPDSGVWETVTGNLGATSTYVYDGSTAMDIYGSGGTMESFAADSTLCATGVVWRYMVMNGGAGAADAGDYLFLEYWDGVDWIVADQYEGGSVDLNIWKPRVGLITHPGVFHAGFKIRLRGQSTVTSDHFYVDNVVVGCAGLDNDGDSYPSGMDCDDTDFWHWTDCGLCVDNDGDGFGPGCDLGPDCDDADINIAPPIPDNLLDGADNDCDMLDVTGWTEDFESGGVNFPVIGANTRIDPSADACGPFSFQQCGDFLRVDGGSANVAETITWNSAGCTRVGWAFEGQRSTASVPEAGNNLYLEWDTGAGWVRAHDWLGGSGDTTWSTIHGTIDDPLALSPVLRFRFVPDATNAIGDAFHIDNFRIGCAD